MRSLRSIGFGLFLALASLALVACSPGQADAQYYRWQGSYNYPYYWSGSTYSPYQAYSPYSNWYGNSGGYYGSYPYYNSMRTYPWGWYW